MLSAYLLPVAAVEPVAVVPVVALPVPVVALPVPVAVAVPAAVGTAPN